jgi:O-antigen ligase
VEPSKDRSALERIDRYGGLVLVALGAWLLVANLVSGGSAIEPVAVVTIACLTYAAARWLGGRQPAAPAAIVLLVVVVSFAWTWPDVVGREPLAGPLGYQNANAALAAEAFVAALAVVLMRDVASTAVRVVMLIAAAALATIPIVEGAWAAAAGVFLVIAVGVWAIIVRTRVQATLLAAGFLILVTVTVLAGVAAATRSSGIGTREPGSPTGARLALWGDAVHMIRAHPIVGIGSGRFADESPTAREDPDLPHAHHEFLEIAAETGVVGGLLLVSAFAWAIVHAGVRRSPEAIVVAAGITALGAHACVDYVLHFPIVPIAAAALVGGVAAHHRAEAEPAEGPDRDRRSR